MVPRRKLLDLAGGYWLQGWKVMMYGRYGKLLPLYPHAAGGMGLGGAAPPSSEVGTNPRMGTRLDAAGRPSW